MPRRNTSDQLQLHPATAAKVQAVLDAWRTRYPRTKVRTFCALVEISPQRLHKILYREAVASPAFLSRCQAVLGVDIGYPEILPKIFGKSRSAK